MDIRKLLGKLEQLNEGTMAQAKAKPTGPKFGKGKWKGTDPASAAKDKYVGGESILRDLEAKLNEDPVKRDLSKEFREFKEAYDHNAPFNAADFNRHMEQLRAREELRKTDPMRALVGDLIDKDNAARNVKKKPQDDSSIDINDPRHPGWGALHGSLNEFAPGNGDDGLPHAEYQVYQCDPEDQFEWIGGPLYQTDNLGMAHKYAYEKYVKHRPKAFMVWQERSQGSRGNYGVKGESDHDEDLKEFAVDKDGDGDGRSRLIGSIAQLLQAKKKVDFYVPGIRGHVAGIGGNGDWVTLKRWNKPYSKVNYSLALDSSDDKRFALKMVRPDYYQVVQTGDLEESWVAAVSEGFSELDIAVMEGGHELIKEAPVAPVAPGATPAPAPAPVAGKPTLGADLTKPQAQQAQQQQQQDLKAQQAAAQKEKQQQATLTKGVNALKSAGAAVSNPNQVVKAFDKAEDNAGLTPADKNNIASAGTVLAPIMANPQLQGKFKDLVTQASAAQKKEQQQQANQPQPAVGAPVAGQVK